MDRSFVGYVKLLVWWHLLFQGSCNERCVTEANKIQICRSQNLISDKIYIDSTDAPEGDDVRCMCTMRRADKLSEPLELTIRTKPDNVGNGKSMEFEVLGQEFSDVDDKDVTIDIDDTISAIVFRRITPTSNTSMCLRILAGGYSTKIQVVCDAFPSDSTRPENSKGSSGGSSILVFIVVGSVIGVILVAVLSLIIIVCTRRSRRSKSSTSQQGDHDEPGSGSNYYTTENSHYVSAEVGNPGNQATSVKVAASDEEQRGLLQGYPTTSPDNTYADVKDQGQDDQCAYAQIDKSTAHGNPTETKDDKHVINEGIAPESVYNITGAPVLDTSTPNDNIYNTFVAEDDYNHLHEVVDPKMTSNNIYGASSDITHKV